jgi:uncharacterized protein YdhG (YjbR/CyaY superfamily)
MLTFPYTFISRSVYDYLLNSASLKKVYKFHKHTHCMKKPSTVDEYIAAAPKELQGKLMEMRKIIKSAAPKAEERISYGMPYYSYKGRLAYFRAGKDYIGLYIPPPVIEEHKSEVKSYATTKATLHFSFVKKLPSALIRNLIKAKMKKNEK